MKILFATILGLAMSFNIALAQNYKAPQINAAGKVVDANGVHIGYVTKAGVIMDEKSKLVATIDSEGNLVDAKTGKKLGKAEKNGNFQTLETNTPDAGSYTVSDPTNGICQVKDSKGNVVGEVHENYKQQAACTIHCLSKKKPGGHEK